MSGCRPSRRTCALRKGGLTACGTATDNEVSLVAAGAAGGTYVASVAVAADGDISATGSGTGIAETYILQPTLTNGQITWAASGSCGTAGLC